MPECSNCGRDAPHDTSFCDWCRLELYRKSESAALKYSFVSLALCLILFYVRADIIFLIPSFACLIGLVYMYYTNREKVKEYEMILNLV
jgi:hypothetical protein